MVRLIYFQNYIQHNKDWKFLYITQCSINNFPSRTTSSTTRIERQAPEIYRHIVLRFQNYIQHNKDWKMLMDLMEIVLVRLPELHPAQQGLKEMCLYPKLIYNKNFQNYIQHNKDWKPHPTGTYFVLSSASRTTSSTTRIESCNSSYSLTMPVVSSRTTSSTTRIESPIQ